MCPISICNKGSCGTRETDQAYTTTNESLEGDLVTIASYTHELFRDDNKTVYFKLEEATRSAAYADTIKPFQRSKDGGAAFEALKINMLETINGNWR